MCIFLRRSTIIVSMFFLCLTIMLGCAGKTHHEFENKIKNMSDEELVSYYHGIEDKIRTVDAKMQAEDRRLDNTKRPDPNLNLISPFFMGGEGYQLIEQRKVVLKEMGMRNITP